MTVGDADVDTWREFCKADDLQDTRKLFSSLCDILRIQQGKGRQTYKLLKERLGDGESKKLWTVLDKRLAMSEYEAGKVCEGKKVLVIGAGPCGLRMAVESALLGAHTVVVEAREKISRNNVLHLWQFVIQDLKMIGIKFFWPKFAVGSLDHVSIRRLQLCLLKLVLILGAEVHCPVTYVQYTEPSPDNGTGWRAELSPASCPASRYDFDCIVGADGKRNNLPGYQRKLMRGKLAIAITANFVNRGSREDSRVQEIGGLFYVFAQPFFNQLQEKTGIELENFVYYKDETHYFVMTPTKKSLLKLGVLRQDFPGEPKKLLSRENVDREKMLHFSKLIATESTEHQLKNVEFALNHRDEEDVAIFDFTAMYQAVNSCYARQKHGHKLLTAIVGDTLIEPFWPTGSGCARGFLGVFDAAWLLKNWFNPDGRNELQVMAERENVYQLLSQSSPNNLKKPYSKHSINPTTRYSTPIPTVHQPHQVADLYVTDVAVMPVPRPRPSRPQQPPPASSTLSLTRKRQRGASLDTHRLRQWYSGRLADFQDVVRIMDLEKSWQDGIALCALVQHYRPGTIDVRKLEPKKRRHNVSMGLHLIEQEFGVSPYLSADEWSTRPDKLTMLSYLANLQEVLDEEEQSGGKMPRLDLPPGVSMGGPASPLTSTLERNNPYKVLNMVSKKHAIREQWKESKNRVSASIVAKKKKAMNSFNDIRTALIMSSKLLRMTTKGGKSASGKKQHVGTAQAAAEPTQNEEKENVPISKPRLSRKHAMRKPTVSSNPASSSDPRKKTTSQPEQSPSPHPLLESRPSIEACSGLVQNRLSLIDSGQTLTDDMKKMSLARNACVGVAGNRIQHWQQQHQPDPLARRQAERRKNVEEKEEEEEEEKEDEEFVMPRVRDMAQKLDDKQKKAVEEAANSDVCCVCGGALYIVNRNTAHGQFFHRDCFRCADCHTHLHLGTSVLHRDPADRNKPRFYCFFHAYKAGAYTAQWSPKQQGGEQEEEGKVAVEVDEEEEERQALADLMEEEEEGDQKEDTVDAAPWTPGMQEEEEEEEEEEDESDTLTESSEEEEEEEEEEEKEPVPHFISTSATSTLKKTATLPKTIAILKNTISARLLQAHTIQQGFDDLEEEGRELDKRGLMMEEKMRRNGGAASDDLLDEWLEVLRQKQDLKERETALMLKVRLSELQEKHMKLQVQIATSMEDPDADSTDLDQLEKDVEELETDMNSILSQMQDLQIPVN